MTTADMFLKTSLVGNDRYAEVVVRNMTGEVIFRAAGPGGPKVAIARMKKFLNDTALDQEHRK